MIYGTEKDYATLERNAWQRGDYQQAEVFAELLDVEQTQSEVDRLQDIVEGIRERITEANWRTGKKAKLRELVESIINELAEVGHLLLVLAYRRDSPFLLPFVHLLPL